MPGKSAMRALALITFIRILSVILIATTGTVAVAQGPNHRTKPKAEQKNSSSNVLQLLPPDSVTRHSIDISTGKLNYIATAGTLPLYGRSGERTAAVFYTSYVADGTAPARRPVTFVFNGGPGAASAYLHLGLVGPRVAEFGTTGREASATRLHDNPDTWLAFTDLVIVDPVGSGWSRAAKTDGGKAFWGVRSDAEALAKTIALWLAKNKRTTSPKFILGESYGGFRSVKVARALQRSQGIAVSGIVMVSPLLEGAFTFGGSRFALGAALRLPSLAAAKLQRDEKFSRERLAQAEQFALTEYLSTLAGAPPQGEAARAFYERVAAFTGLPVEVVAQTRGFIGNAYIKALRGGRHEIVSRYDVTFAVPDPYPEQRRPRGPDPLLDGITRAYGGAFVTYARNELGFNTDMTYVLLSSQANHAWDWGEGGSRATASAESDIRALLSLDPAFRLMVAHGYTDMVTPYAVSRYVLDHLPDMGHPSRARLQLYRGGHMFYLDIVSRRAFSADAKAFYDAEP